MRDALTNPFSPGSDVVPPVWAGRVSQLSDWERVVRPRRVAGLYERGRTILGEAGLGKSTLVRRVAATAARQGDWVTPQLRIPAGADPLRAVAGAVLALADEAGLAAARERRLTDLLERVRAVSAGGISLAMDRGGGPEAYRALTELLVAVGTAAIDRDVAVVVHVDEVQNITDEKTLSQLLVCLGDAGSHEVEVAVPGGARITRVLPVAVYLTGLPEFAETTGSLAGATFARRFATTVLDPISDDDLRLALHEFVTPGWEVADGRGGVGTIRMEEEAVEAIVGLCCGEPFLFQLAGERAWYAGTAPVITARDVYDGWSAARTEAAAHVERILQRLPPKERELVRVMAEMPGGERTATNIARALGYDSVTKIGTATQRLDTTRGIITRGKPYTFRHRAIESYLTSDWPDVTGH